MDDWTSEQDKFVVQGRESSGMNFTVMCQSQSTVVILLLLLLSILLTSIIIIILIIIIIIINIIIIIMYIRNLVLNIFLGLYYELDK